MTSDSNINAERPGKEESKEEDGISVIEEGDMEEGTPKTEDETTDRVNSNNEELPCNEESKQQDEISGKEEGKPKTDDETSNRVSSNNDELLFPKSILCPITNKIMKNPVVHPDGISYEKKAIMERDGTNDSSIYYPNRALVDYIEIKQQEIEFKRKGSIRRSSRKLLLRSLSETMEASVRRLLPGYEDRPLPECLYCPITFDLIRYPVIDKDGNSYEKKAIVKWIQNNGDSPVTRNKLNVEELYKNTTLLNVLKEETDQYDDEDDLAGNPSIRRWKEHVENNDAEAGGEEDETTTYPLTHQELEARRRQESLKFFVQLLLLCCCIFLLLCPQYYLGAILAALCFTIWHGSATDSDDEQNENTNN